MYTALSIIPNKSKLQKYIFEAELENSLSEEDKSVCDGEITVSKCSDAANEMKWNKSPVFDGVSVEFYKTLWDKLKYFLTKTYYKSLRTSVNIFTAFKCTSIAIQKRGSIIIR